MGLRINTNIASLAVQKNLKSSNSLQEAEFSKLSSGKRITKSADDAAGLAIAKKLEAKPVAYGWRQKCKRCDLACSGCRRWSE